LAVAPFHAGTAALEKVGAFSGDSLDVSAQVLGECLQYGRTQVLFILKVWLHFQVYEISRVLPASFAPFTGLFYARIIRFWPER